MAEGPWGLPMNRQRRLKPAATECGNRNLQVASAFPRGSWPLCAPNLWRSGLSMKRELERRLPARPLAFRFRRAGPAPPRFPAQSPPAWPFDSRTPANHRRRGRHKSRRPSRRSPVAEPNAEPVPCQEHECHVLNQHHHGRNSRYQQGKPTHQ